MTEPSIESQLRNAMDHIDDLLKVRDAAICLETARAKRAEEKVERLQAEVDELKAEKEAAGKRFDNLKEELRQAESREGSRRETL